MSGCGRCAAQSRFWRLKDALDELQALDLLQCFGDAVDEEAVPTYRTVIAKPMDFGTMRATNPNPNPNPNQDPELRAKFAGQSEHVINFLWMMAEEVREHMAQMGFRTFEEMVGRADMLRVDESALHSKSATLDLGPILTPAASLAPGEPQFNAQVWARCSG